MKHILLFSFLGIFLSCQQPKTSPSSETESSVVQEMSVPVQNINPNIDIMQAKELMEKTPEIVLIDVRTPEEIASGKIGNALEIDITAPDFKDKLATLDKNKEYIVYCAAGGRSARAVGMMNEMGFTKTYNMQPGYNGWSSQQ